jgi:hypothetical protein
MALQAVPTPAQKEVYDGKGPFISAFDAVPARPPDRSICNDRRGKLAGSWRLKH